MSWRVSTHNNIGGVLLQKGRQQMLVYYWFQQRDRTLTNEYLVKFYLFWDAVTKNRTDGALVRFMTYLPDGSSLAEADERMAGLLRDTHSTLQLYLPK